MNLTEYSLAFVFTLTVAALAGCSDGSSSSNNNENAHETKVEALLALNTTGGDDAIGQWTVMDADLSPLAAPVKASGTPTLDAFELAGEFRGQDTGARAGFQFNRVDGYFYGVLPATANAGVEPPSRGTSFAHGDVIRFHPGTDVIEHVATIPYLHDPDADPITTEAYGDFVTAPAISPDGKSLLLVARLGGQPIPEAPDDRITSRTIGGVVHLDIDPASANYLKFTPVYDFHDVGEGDGWEFQLERVETQPLLAETWSGPVLFLVTNSRNTGTDILPEINPSEPLSLVPSDPDDWSQPWNILGPIVNQFVQPAQNVYYDPFQNEFWWAAEVLTSSDLVLQDTQVFKRSGPDGAVEFNLTFIPKTFGATSPQAVFTYPGIGATQLITAGSVPGCNTTDPDNQFQCIGKVIDVKLADTQIVRTTLDNYWTGNDSRLLAAGLASSLSTGEHFLNGVSSVDARQLNDDISARLNTLPNDLPTLPSENPYLSRTLDELYADSGVLPARLDRYDFGSFASAKLYEGTTEKGYMLIGSPAIGGLASEPLNDRYVVSLAIHGGANGAGAIIKHDRLTNTTTSIALGTAMPSAPIGKAIQLDNGSLLGGTYRRAQAGLFPQLSEHGVWVKPSDEAAPIVDYELPAIDHPCIPDTCLADAIEPPIAFVVQASNGSVWATVQYQLRDLLLLGQCGDCLNIVMALAEFDAQTGQPTGEVHILTDNRSEDGAHLIGSGSFTEASIRGNILTYLTPALKSDSVSVPVPPGQNYTGQRLWLVDLADRDINNAPGSNAVVLSPYSGGAAGTAWFASFAPTLQASSGNFYFTTELTDSGSELQVHRLELGATVADATITTVVTGQTRIAGTPLFEASNGLFYYGTRDGRLMSFDPSTDMIAEIADLTASGAGMTSDVRGFLSETSSGILMGIVVDSSASQSEVASRAFKYDLSAGGLPTSVDASDFVSVQDPFPGLPPISYSP